jgi:hypothetical protein
LHQDAITPTSTAGCDPETLRYGDRVVIDGRPAIFAYLTPAHTAAVIRYQGERDTRVVSLRKLRLPG